MKFSKVASDSFSLRVKVDDPSSCCSDIVGVGFFFCVFRAFLCFFRDIQEFQSAVGVHVRWDPEGKTRPPALVLAKTLEHAEQIFVPWIGRPGFNIRNFGDA